MKYSLFEHKELCAICQTFSPESMGWRRNNAQNSTLGDKSFKYYMRTDNHATMFRDFTPYSVQLSIIV